MENLGHKKILIIASVVILVASTALGVLQRSFLVYAVHEYTADFSYSADA